MISSRGKAAALAAALLAAPWAVFGSGERVDAFGRSGYIQDEEVDLGLNPAMAVLVKGDRLFANLGSALSSNRANTAAQKTKARSSTVAPSLELVTPGDEWAWALRWSPSFVHTDSESRTYDLAGNLTSQAASRGHKNDYARTRLLAARKGPAGSLGLSLEYQEPVAKSVTTAAHQETHSRGYSADLGWLAGKAGEPQLGLTLGGDYSKSPSENSLFGETDQDLTAFRLRVVPQKPLGDSFLRGRFEVYYNRSRTHLPPAFTSRGSFGDAWSGLAGAGLESVAGPRTRWSAVAEAQAIPYSKLTTLAKAGPDTVTKSWVYQFIARFGLEHFVTEKLAVRGTADFLQWQISGSRATDGTSSWAKILNGPLEALTLGLGYTPREDVTFDASVLTDYAQWSHFGNGTGPTTWSDTRTWNLTVDAVMTVRFGGPSPAPAKSRGRR